MQTRGIYHALEGLFLSYELLLLFQLRASDNSQFIKHSSHSASHHSDSNKGPIQESTRSERYLALTGFRFSLTPLHIIDILFPAQPRGRNGDQVPSIQPGISRRFKVLYRMYGLANK